MLFGEYKEWTDQEWIEHLNNVETFLFTRCDFYIINTDERIRCYFDNINGLFVRIALDYKEIQWVAIYIPGSFTPSAIKNPESKYLKELSA